MRSLGTVLLALSTAAALTLAGCGDTADDTSADDTSADDTSADDTGDGERPSVVVTTNILGDVVEHLVGEQVDVITIMPVGADPHTFEASAQQVNEIREADALIVNGAGFEEGLLDVIESAESDGVPTHEAISAVETIELGEGGHEHEEDEDEEEDGEEDEEEDEEHHHHEGEDPHFFSDPDRMSAAAAGILEFLADTVDAVDATDVEDAAAAYLEELHALDGEVADTLADIPDDQRVLVTNHEVFGYFADRYDFEVVGTVIPSGSTANGTSARELDELAGVIEDEGVPAVFADTSSSADLARTLADEVGDVEVVELFSESLGPADSEGATYVDMVRTNAERIAAALGG